MLDVEKTFGVNIIIISSRLQSMQFTDWDSS